jgi:acyl-CoA thioester hydrolase
MDSLKRKKTYFERLKDAPAPITARTNRRSNFSEVDMLSVVWHGRFAAFFEDAYSKIGRRCGMTYQDYKKYNLVAPISQFHIDYYNPIHLQEKFIVQASMIWTNAPKINTEYIIFKEDNSIACTGYTVQPFINTVDQCICFTTPEFYKAIQKKWLNGEFNDEQ